MTRTRAFKQAAQPVVQTPKNHNEWKALLNQVIDRAERMGHRQLPGLRAAMTENRAETHLRRLGIISQNDLDREFPQPP